MKRKNEQRGELTASGFSDALKDIINTVGASATYALDEAVVETAKDVKKRIEGNARHWGWSADYYKGFRIQKNKDSRFATSVIIYHDAPGYRLVHLLEFGHRIEHLWGTGGEGWAQAYPHMQPAVENLDDLLLKNFKEKFEQ
jgi:hypothetical protein